VRYIKKSGTTIPLLQNKNAPVSSGAAQTAWKNFKKKEALNTVLLDEQLHLCAYTELRPDQLGLSTHIEHVKPKSKFPAQTFDYRNLVASILNHRDLQSYAKADQFGGHAKGNHYDKRHFMSPLKASARRNYFLYLCDGRVVPSEKKSRRYQKKAKHTIDLLNLNAPLLVNQRKRWIEELEEWLDEQLEAGTPIEDIALVDLIPTKGKLNSFFTATRQFFYPKSEKVLKDYAPYLL